MDSTEESANLLFHKITDNTKNGNLFQMGPYASFAWRINPKHLFFNLARHKFCAKLLVDAKSLLAVGCGDAFAFPLFFETAERIVGIDVIPDIIAYNQAASQGEPRTEFMCHDIVASPLTEKFSAAFSLDVIEHIHSDREDAFVKNISASLLPHGCCIIGTPNLTSAPYASAESKASHINLKDHQSLKAIMAKYFHNVFIFSMNDEVVHTGFYPMAHYLLALAIDPKRE